MADGTMGGALDAAVFRVRCGYLASGQHCQTGFHVRDVAVNDNSAQDVVDAVDTWFNGTFKAYLIDRDKLEYINVTKLFSEEGATKEYVNVSGGTGISDSSVAPTFLAINIAMKTQRRKRYGQGRMFWPIRDDRRFDDNILNATGIAAAQGVIDDLLAKFTGVSADLHLCNQHLTLPARPATTTSPARPEIAPHWYDVDVVKLDTTVRALRSRLVGHGA